jgi:hypothetical protein
MVYPLVHGPSGPAGDCQQPTPRRPIGLRPDGVPVREVGMKAPWTLAICTVGLLTGCMPPPNGPPFQTHSVPAPTFTTQQDSGWKDFLRRKFVDWWFPSTPFGESERYQTSPSEPLRPTVPDSGRVPYPTQEPILVPEPAQGPSPFGSGTAASGNPPAAVPPDVKRRLLRYYAPQ